MIEFEDVALAASIVAVIVGLAMIYLPLAMIVPGAVFISWAAYRRRRIG